MVYDLMIEEWEQIRDEYVATRKKMIDHNRTNYLQIRIINTRIEMTEKFIDFLKRCERQEMELDEECRRMQAEESR